MNELLEQLREDFKNEEARYAYAEGFLNASIAAQIKTLRAEMSQQQLADKVGTKQSGISRLENVNYSAWKVETLRKLARAFGLRLRISFEEFGTLVPEIENFKKGTLQRRNFEKDPVFKEPEVKEPQPQEEINTLQWLANPTKVDSDNFMRIQSQANEALMEAVADVNRRIDLGAGGLLELSGALRRSASEQKADAEKTRLHLVRSPLPTPSQQTIKGINPEMPLVA